MMDKHHRKQRTVLRQLHMISGRWMNYTMSFLLLFTVFLSAMTISFVSSPMYVKADTLSDLQKQQEQTQQQIDSLLQQKESAKNQVNSLQGEVSSLNGTYQKYTSQLNTVQNQIATAQSQIASTNQGMQQLSDEIALAKEKEQQQYDAMCKRIAYIYSHESSNSFWTILIESGSISEFVTRMQKVSALISYDRKMMASYQQLQDTIAKKSDVLQQKQKELTAYQEVLNTSESQLDSLTDNAQSALTDKHAQVAEAKNVVDDYDTQLADLTKEKASLDVQAADAQAAVAQQMSQEQNAEEESGIKEDTSAAVNASVSDVEFLAATIQAEADNQPYDGKLAVGSVIMNRVNSSKFPNTITGVVTQYHQFASYPKLINFILNNGGPNKTCMAVAQEVVSGKRNGDWLFFMTEECCARYGITGYQKIGDHCFFWKWGTN